VDTRYWEQKAELAHENNSGKTEKANDKSSSSNNNNNVSSSNNNSNNNSGKKNDKKSNKGQNLAELQQATTSLQIHSEEQLVQQVGLKWQANSTRMPTLNGQQPLPLLWRR
jgi:hypothetical protein